jgi:probable selenium-dependent hydroxylase accessory protein YqeC
MINVADVSFFDNLKNSFGLGERELVSIVGAGGKTTLMYKLAEELYRDGSSVAAATTTRIFAPLEDEPVTLYCGEMTDDLKDAIRGAQGKPPILGSRLLENNKVAGIKADQCNELFNSGALNYLIVEADGARRKPLKAPGESEPVVPLSTTIFVAVIGLSCLDEKLSDETAFRPELVAQAGKINMLDRISRDSLVNLLSAENGLRKGCPPQAQSVVLLNQADTPEQIDAARQIADKLLSGNAGWDRVIIGHLTGEEPIEESWIK